MPTPTPELLATLRLTLVKGIGPRILRNLVEYFGTAEQVFQADLFELRRVEEVGAQLAMAILNAPQEINVEKELELCEKHEIQILLTSAPEYPALLKTIPDPPILLYVQGKLQPQDSVSLAMIGTRHATFYGERQAERLAGEFVRSGFSIVSGLARGIDGVSQKAALDAGGRTIAVLGHGLAQKVYPPEHANLAKRIIDAGCALVSEYPPLQPVTAKTFPRRNRIIAGMTLGTAVIEAGSRSGTMLTAEFALDYGREVFAMPGPVDSRSSTGCHRLIRQGAKLLESVEDVLEELGPIRDRFPKECKAEEMMVEHPAEISMTETEKAVFEAIPKDGATVDELTQLTGIPVWKLMTQLTGLEVKRLIKRGAGQRVYKC
ncbi:MAG: DNA-processing protein DprA [Thermoguttaceae bacterium]